jgi:6-phosphofructokinase
MKKALALMTAAAFGFTLGTAFADEATVSPLQQQPSAMVVATSKEEVKQMETKEKKREKKEKRREKKEKKREKEQKLKIKEKKLEAK